MSEKLHFVS